MVRIATVFFLILAVSLPSAASDKKRAKILRMKEEVLTELYQQEPDTREEIDESEGYAVFSNVGVNVIFLSAGGGKGVAIDNRSGNKTFMKMASAGVGLGLGIKDFRGVFIFHSRDAYEDFVEKGWDFSAQADAAAQSGEKGGEASGAANIRGDVTVYQITKNGIALQATLQGTKYWKDKKLNRKK